MAFQKYDVKKDPDSIMDYGRTWGDWLEVDEEITSSEWIIASEEDPITLIEDSAGTSVDLKDTSIWLSGGTPGMKYDLTNRIFTNYGRKEDRTGTLTVQEK